MDLPFHMGTACMVAPVTVAAEYPQHILKGATSCSSRQYFIQRRDFSGNFLISGNFGNSALGEHIFSGNFKAF